MSIFKTFKRAFVLCVTVHCHVYAPFLKLCQSTTLETIYKVTIPYGGDEVTNIIHVLLLTLHYLRKL